MKLKPEHIRKIMLTLERQITVNSDLSMQGVNSVELSTLLPKIPREEIFYTLCRLDEAGFISFNVQYSGDVPAYDCVDFITYDGHVFLDTIRDAVVWRETKKTISKVGATAPELIANVASAFLLAKLGL